MKLNFVKLHKIISMLKNYIYHICQGSPNTGPWPTTGPWPIWNQSVQVADQCAHRRRLACACSSTCASRAVHALYMGQATAYVGWFLYLCCRAANLQRLGTADICEEEGLEVS